MRDFPGGPEVRNLPSNAGDTDSIPGRGTKIPQALGKLSPCIATKSLAACVPQEDQAQSKKKKISWEFWWKIQEIQQRNNNKAKKIWEIERKWFVNLKISKKWKNVIDTAENCVNYWKVQMYKLSQKVKQNMKK